jgi:TolB-like protein/tetratricopeptide (TPR) repeat protein
VLVFSWAYELTPEGVKLEKDVDRSTSITSDTGRKLNIATIGMLIAVLFVVAAERLYFHDESEAPTQTVIAPEVIEQSIAVLAFEDLSPGGDQAYFAEGLSEELLNVLAKVPDLKVAGRTSSFAFKGKQTDLREIGELLNVAHILEGSVRKAGDRIRVTAQLIKASDGFHVYSETFDRDLDDVFAVQDEIASAISRALLTEVLGAGPDEVATTDTQAFDLYLMARQRIHSRDIYDLREANTMLDSALEIDPIYAPALAQKGLVTHLLSDSMGAYGDTPLSESLPVSKRFVDQALALDPNLAEAHAVNGLLLDEMERFEDAVDALTRALEINPNLSDAGNWLGHALQALGRLDEELAVREKVFERDPTYGPGFANLISNYARRGEADKANAVIDRMARIVGENDDMKMSRGIVALTAGEAAKSTRLLRESLDFNPSATVTEFWYALSLLGLADYESLLTEGPPEYRLQAHAAYGDHEKALAVIESIDIDSTFAPRTVWEIGRYFNRLGNSTAFLDYIVEQFGSVEGLLEKQAPTQGWGTAYLGELIFALRQVGDEEFAESLLGQLRRYLDDELARGVGNWLTAYHEAEHAALSGDAIDASNYLNTAMDRGFRQLEFTTSAIFSPLADDAGMVAARKRLVQLIDAERAKLGMPPYRPIAATDDGNNKPSFVN